MPLDDVTFTPDRGTQIGRLLLLLPQCLSLKNHRLLNDAECASKVQQLPALPHKHLLFEARPLVNHTSRQQEIQRPGVCYLLYYFIKALDRV